MEWLTCFPDWKEEIEDVYTDDQVTADVLKTLVPVSSNACARPNHTDPVPPTPPTDSGVCLDGVTDAAYMMEHYAGSVDASIESIMWHWFFQATINSEETDWDCVLMYIFQESGSHCSVLRDTTADILDTAGTKWVNLDSFVENQ
jgi:hypothetical protein